MQPAKKLLITGSSGFIGQHVCAQALLRGHIVQGLDLRHDPHAPFAQEFKTRFKTQVRDVSSLLPQDLQGIDVIIHLAATVSVPLCEQHLRQSTDNNLRLVLHLLETAPRSCPVVFASSSAVYGPAGDHINAIPETAASLWPLSYYAVQKRSAEMFLQTACRNEGRRAIALRFFNVYGAGQDPTSPYSGVLSRFLRLALDGQPLSIHGDGTQTRDFVAVQDVAYAVINAAESIATRPESYFATFNVGTGQRTQIRELAERLINLVHMRSQIQFTAPRVGDVRHSCADLSYFEKELGPLPKTPLLVGLETLLQTIRRSGP